MELVVPMDRSSDGGIEFAGARFINPMRLSRAPANSTSHALPVTDRRGVTRLQIARHNLIVDSISAAPTDEIYRAAGLFWHIDAKTSDEQFLRFSFQGHREAIAPDDELTFRANTVQRVFGWLASRVQERRRGRLAARTGIVSDAALAYISSLLLAPLRYWYPGFDRCNRQRKSMFLAVARFATGQLGMSGHSTWIEEHEFLTAGAPNSAAFTYFSEFGFLAIERNVDRRDWEVVTPAFVNALALYEKAFQPAQSLNTLQSHPAPKVEIEEAELQLVLDLPNNLTAAYEASIRHIFG